MDDEIFVKDFIPRLSRPVLALLRKQDRNAFAQVVRAYDFSCLGSHPFSYTDTIADTFKKIFELEDDLALREMALRRILVVGAEHSRYYVRTTACEILEGLRDPQDVLMAARVLREERDAAEFIAASPAARSYAPAIREAVMAA